MNDEPSPTRVTITRNGPILIEGPVEVVLDDGRVVRSDRFVVAVCACRRSRKYPWCDTSHRRHSRSSPRRTEEIQDRASSSAAALVEPTAQVNDHPCQ